MKKIFAIIMSVLMIACFMPSMAFAETESKVAPNTTIGDYTFSKDNTIENAVEVNGGDSGVIIADWTDAWLNTDTTIKNYNFTHGAVFNAGANNITITLEGCTFGPCDQSLLQYTHNNSITNSGAGMCLNLEKNDKNGVSFVVKNCTFIGENNSTLSAYGIKYNANGSVESDNKKRGHAIALDAICGGGTGTLESLLIDKCTISGVRGNAIQLYGSTGDIMIKDTEINSWGINKGDGNGTAIRGDFEKTDKDGTKSINRTLTIDNVYFGLNEDKTGGNGKEKVHVEVGSCFVGNTDGERAAGTYSVSSCEAKVGSKPYKTLSDAITKTESGSTITLLNDVTSESIAIPESKTVTIDIAGHTLSKGVGGTVTVENNGKLIIKDSAGTGKIAFDPSSYLESGYYASKTTDGETTYWTIKKYTYSGGSSSSSTTTTTTDTVTNKTEDKTTDTSTSTGTTTVATTTATVKTETTTATDGTKTVAATVDTTTASKIVEKAVENKSEEVVIDTATTSSTGTAAVTETAAGTTTKVDLPEQTVKAIAEKTEAAVTIKSDAAEIKLDTEAVKAVAEQAGDTGTVNLVVETVAQNEAKVEVDLKLVTSKGTVSDFKGGNVTVTVKLNTKLAAKPVVCVYIDDNGTYHKVKGVKNADGTYTFETGHFSTYAVMAEEDADKVIAEQTANVNELVSALTLKARSAKTAKGNIKVTLTADEDAIKAIEDLGYTVKYKFYRSTKKSASYKAKLEGTGKTYTNTTGKKGTKYYYKARVMVYSAQGELIAKSELKQCRYAARTR